MQNRELEAIFLGCQVIGVTLEQIASFAGCGIGTIFRASTGLTVKPSTVRAIYIAADMLAEQGYPVRRAGKLALKRIPPEAKRQERWGYVKPYVKEILAEAQAKEEE